MADWRIFLHKLGFGQKRCACCLRPYFPEVGLFYLYPTDLLCEDCQSKLFAYAGPCCSSCGNPTEEGKKVCKVCQKDPPPWDNIAFYGLYAGKLRELILRLKFSSQFYLAPVFGDLLFQASLCLPRPDVVTCIPQTPAQLRKRGHNQTNEIARTFAKLSKLSYDNQLLCRVHAARPQEGLSSEERKKNVQGAFIAHKRVCAKSVWLIDDVMTSGATLKDATRALKTAGAGDVSVLFLARTSH